MKAFAECAIGDIRRLRASRTAILVLGGLCVILALGADLLLPQGAGAGFGVRQRLLLLIGLLLAVPALLVPSRHFDRWVLKPLLLLGSFYFSLALASWLLAQLGPSVESGIVRGLYVRDDAVGYRLSPNFTGVDTGCPGPASYTTNSRGHRDAEPEPTDARRILLLGDSYTFGICLDAQSTFDKQMEDLSGNAIDAYNAGVPGYGPAGILRQLESTEGFLVSDVVYFFYMNDLSDRELDPLRFTVSTGYLVHRIDEEGRVHTEEELAQKASQIITPSIRTRVENFVGLNGIRAFVKRLQGESERVSPHNVEHAAAFAAQMRELSLARGARFMTVIIPSYNEASAQQYSPPVERYISLLEQQDIEVLSLLGIVGPDDYFHPDDPHFNPAGARAVAKATLERLH